MSRWPLMRLLFWARVVTGGLIEGCDSEGNAQGLSKWISSNPIILGIPTTSFKHWTLYSQRNLQLPQNPWRGRVRREKCLSMPFPPLASPPRHLYHTSVSSSAFLTQTEQKSGGKFIAPNSLAPNPPPYLTDPYNGYFVPQNHPTKFFRWDSYIPKWHKTENS